MDYDSTNSTVKDVVNKIDTKLAALCNAEKTSVDDCNGKLDKDLLRNLKVAWLDMLDANLRLAFVLQIMEYYLRLTLAVYTQFSV